MSLSDFSKYGNAAGHLKNAILQGMVSHAYIIEGDHTVDKLGFAKAFGQAILCRERKGEGCGNCPSCRQIEMETYEDLVICAPQESAGSKSHVLSVRDAQVEELQEKLKLKPAEGARNLAIIDGADSMTMRAQTRLLKTLEEPYPGTVIMLLSENSEYLLPTIQSRCVKVRLVDFSHAEENPESAAADVLEMIHERKFFFDVKERLDGAVKSRPDAYAFLDDFEKVLDGYMRRGCPFLSVSQLSRAVAVVEQVRRMIQQNASYKYGVRFLVLQIRRIMDGTDE